MSITAKTGQARWGLGPTTMAMIPVGVALNLGVGTLVQVVKLPVFLDQIGSVSVAVLCGPLAGALTGLITVGLGGLLTNPVLPYFACTAVAVGWFTGFCAGRGGFRSWWRWGACGLAMGVISAIVSAPVVVALFGGVTPSGSSLVVAFLLASGKTVLNSVLLAGLACDPFDKLLTYLIARSLLLGLPRSLRAQFPCGLANTEWVPTLATAAPPQVVEGVS